MRVAVGKGVGVRVAVGEGVGVRVAVGEGVGVRVAVGEGVGVKVAVGEGVGVRVAVGEGVGVRVAVGEGVGVRVAVGEGVWVRDAVGEGVGVRDAVGKGDGRGDVVGVGVVGVEQAAKQKRTHAAISRFMKAPLRHHVGDCLPQQATIGPIGVRAKRLLTMQRGADPTVASICCDGGSVTSPLCPRKGGTPGRGAAAER